MDDNELLTHLNDLRAVIGAEQRDEARGGEPGFAAARKGQLDEALRAAQVRGLDTR